MTIIGQLWNFPSMDFALASNFVHVWRASFEQLASCFQQLAQVISPDERKRAKSFYFEQDRRWFIMRCGLLRMILGRYLCTEPSRPRFRYNPYGKPSITEAPNGSTLRFNGSHSHGLVLYAITQDRKLGVDVEYVHPLPEVKQIARHFFSAREVASLCKLPRDKKLQGFFNCWTRKEAYIKATGYGLARDLNQFSVSLAPAGPVRLLNVNWDPNEISRWSLVELTPAPGYVGALCVEGHDWRLIWWECPTVGNITRREHICLSNG